MPGRWACEPPHSRAHARPLHCCCRCCTSLACLAPTGAPSARQRLLSRLHTATGWGASGGPRRQRGAPGLKGPPRPLRTRARATPSPLSPLGLGPLPRAPLRGPSLPPQRPPRRASAWASPRLVTGAASASSPGLQRRRGPPEPRPLRGPLGREALARWGGAEPLSGRPRPRGVQPTRGRTQATCTRGPRSCRALCQLRPGVPPWLPQGGQSAAPGRSRVRPRWRGDGCRPALRNQIR